MLYRCGSGIGSTTGERCSDHAERQLRDCRVMAFRNGIEHPAGLRQLTGGDRKPWNERKLVLLAILKNVLLPAIRDVVLVLHADDVITFRA